VQGLLDGAGARGLAGAAAAGAAHLRVGFVVEGTSEAPRSQPMLMLTPQGEPGAASRSPLFIPLGAEDSGRSVGPLPAGTYEASLVADAYRSDPRRSRLVLAAGQRAELQVRLVAQGTLGGYVSAARSEGPAPAGSYKAPDTAVRITAIELRGPGVRRWLAPRSDGVNDVPARYIDGDDAMHGALFSFVGLPEGRYTLCIEAIGHRPHCSEHHVVPGVPRPFTPIELMPLR
jgi:hypothetical protein